MRHLNLRRAAVIATASTLVVVAVLAWWTAVTIELDPGKWLFVAIIVALIGGAGLFLFRVPDHPVPWLLFAITVGVGIGQMAVEIADAVGGARRVVLELLAFGGWWPSVVLGAVFLPLLFPTGHPPGRRWRWVGWSGAGAIVAITGWYVVAVARDCAQCSAVGVGWLDAVYNLAIGILVLTAMAAVASLAVRYRRAVGTERKQLQWLVLPLTVGVIGLFLIAVVDGPVAVAFFMVGALGVPVGIVIAITKHRLYDLDRLVSRTVSYMIVIGALALVFSTGAIWIPQRLSGGGSNFAVAASTLAVAALFNPVRKRVTRAVDRRFHRLAYEPDQVLADIGTCLRNRVDMMEVAESLVAVTSRALRPASTAVWVRERP